MTRYDAYKLDTPPRFEASPMIECDDCGQELSELSGKPPIEVDGLKLCEKCAGPRCELCDRYGTEDNPVGLVKDPASSDGRLAVCFECIEWPESRMA